MKNNDHITIDKSQPTMALMRIACGLLLTAGAASAETISEVGAWPGYTRQAPKQVAGNGTTAYLVGSKGLQIFDLSSPSQPQLLSFLPCVEYLVEDPTDIHLQAESNRVCIGVINPNQLKGIDVSNLANPTQVWTNSLLSWPNHVFTDENDVYSSHNAAGLSHSSWSSTLSGHRYSAIPAFGRVAVVSNRVYVPTTSGFDVRDKNSLTTLIGAYNAGAWANALAVEGDYAYLAATNGLHVVNIQNEAAPVSEGVLELAASAFEPTAVGLVPGHACLVFKRTNLLMTVNVESPESPTAVGSYVLPQPAEDLSVSDERALVLAPVNSSDTADLYAIDLSVPGDPVLETRLHLNGTSRELALAGNALFVADGDNGLCILDVVTPSNPGVVAHQPPQGPILEYASVAATDDLAFLGGDLNGFSVFEISNPEEPVLVTNFWDWTDAAQYLEVVGNHLFTVAGFAMLTVRDVTNDFVVLGTPKSIMNEVRAFGMAGDQFALLLEMDWMSFSPILEIIDAQSVDLPTVTNYSGGAEIVDVVGQADGGGTNAFLATTNGLKILDLGDPNNIHSIGEWNCPAGFVPTCICVDGNRIGLASTNHLWIIDRNELGGGNPIIAETDIAYSFSEMILSGTDLYAAAGADGVVVYQLGSAPSQPTLFIADNPPDTVRLEWTAAGTGWYLQHSAEPGDAESWSTVPASETITSTNLPRTATGQFFRLMQP